MKLYDNKYPISDNAEYVVDYIYDKPPAAQTFYFQLVRLKDNAILCARKSQTDIILHCWSVGIPKEKVAFI